MTTNAIDKTELTEQEIRRCAYLVMKSFGVGQNLTGYNMAVESVVLCIQNPDYLKNASRKDGLYDVIAHKFDKDKSAHAERAIRTLVERITQMGAPSAVSKIFGKGAITSRPDKAAFVPNMDFIAGICNYIKYEHDSIGDL